VSRRSSFLWARRGEVAGVSSGNGASGRMFGRETELGIRVAWALVASAVTITWAVAVAAQWKSLTSVCHRASSCTNFQMDEATAHLLAAHGIQPEVYGVYTALGLALVWAVWCGLGGLIVWRRPREVGAVVSAFFMVLFPLFEISFWFPSGNGSQLMGAVAFLALTMFYLLFPNGSFAPRWFRFVPIALIPLGLISNFLPWLLGPMLLVFFLSVSGSQIYRFRMVSSWKERQQTKWTVAGLLVSILLFVAVAVVPFSVDPKVGYSGTGYEVLTITLVPIVTTLIPLSVGAAIFRSGLWDIDRIINRALVYGVLSIALAVAYVGGVLGLEALFRLFIRGSAAPAIVVSTLAIAALFGPLRRRIQDAIDRRFYRARYDTARILSAFGDRLRQEVDLMNLTQDMTSVVQETLRPEHVSIWLSGEMS